MKKIQSAISFFAYDNLLNHCRDIFSKLPDSRSGKNIVYSMEDAAMGAFSVFFTQSPSFLDFQRNMELAKGQSNAQSLFEISDIPTDNQIRNILDPVSPSEVFPCFSGIINRLYESGYFDPYKSVNGTLLLALDGTQYFSSKKISCENCTVTNHKNGEVTYSHTAITPVITAADTNIVFPLEPEFITPQDGHDKQDCENTAAKRWLSKFGSHYFEWGITILGDDLYCKQPVCEAIESENLYYILVCKPSSHQTLYKYIENTDEIIFHMVTEIKNGQWLYHTYRFLNQAPLRAGDDALDVNWCELTTRNDNGDIIYHNAFAANHEINADNVAEIVKAGRARWKIENENNNTLKTKGYNLKHNFGHGNMFLASILATLNLLAFLLHTVLELTDTNYKSVRKKLVTRKNFFNDLRALTRYWRFNSWNSLLLFMMRGLEINPADTS